MRHDHGPMNGSICSVCGRMASRGSAARGVDDEGSSAAADAEMRAFSDDIRAAIGLRDLLRSRGPKD